MTEGGGILLSQNSDKPLAELLIDEYEQLINFRDIASIRHLNADGETVWVIDIGPLEEST